VFRFGWFITPEPAELKLARIRAGVDFSIPVLPPEVKALRCVLMWVGGPRGEPEMWCRRQSRPSAGAGLEQIAARLREFGRELTAADPPPEPAR
jgi:hypothetical protein